MEIKPNFNILREIYLNKDNRNILSEFLKYISRKEIIPLIDSMYSDTRNICGNCFCKISFLMNSLCGNYYLFCSECILRHFDKYSEFKCITMDSYENCITVLFNHRCDIYKGITPISKEHVNSYKFIKKYVDVDKINAEPSNVFSFGSSMF